jgi:tryptophan-rich sensory protein
VAMCKMNYVYIKMMLKVESLKTGLLKVSPPVPCGVVCVGVCLVTQILQNILLVPYISSSAIKCKTQL